MAEAVATLSLVASVLQLVDFGGQLVRRIDDFLCATQAVPAAFRTIRLQLPVAINTLQKLVEQGKDGRITTTDAQALLPLVDSSLSLTKTLTLTLNKAVPAMGSSSFIKGFYAVKSFRYDKEVQRNVEQLQNNIQILLFQQSTHMSDVALAICQKLERLELSAWNTGNSLQHQQTISNGSWDRVGLILSWLRAVDLEAIKREKAKTPGTCEWINEQEAFARWKIFLGPSGLWIRGIAGCGKSVLASSLIDALTRDYNTFYFFCRGTDPEKRTAAAILRTLASQLIHCIIFTGSLAASDAVFEKVWAICHTFTDIELVSVDTLWRILEMLLAPVHCPTFIIDGFDECNAHHNERKFLAEKFTNSIRSESSIRLLFLSRNMEELQSLVGPSLGLISIQEADVKCDISIMVEERLARSAKLFPIKDKIVLPITEGSGGMFLWAHLMLINLETSVTFRSVQGKLREMPAQLDAMYLKIIQDIASNLTAEERRYQQRLLMWIATALRPLHLRELSTALSITAHINSLAEEDLILDIRTDVTNLCGPLVWIHQNGTVHPIHVSVKETLCKRESSDVQMAASNGSRDRNYAKSSPTHLDVGNICLTYLSVPLLAEPSTQASLAADQSFAGHLAREMPFLEYAASFWPLHLVESTLTEEEPVERVIEFLESNSTFTWLECYSYFAALASGEFGHHFQVQAKLRDWVSRHLRACPKAKSVIDNYLIMASQRIVNVCKTLYGPADEQSLAVMSRLGTLFAFLDRHAEAREIRLEVFNGYQAIFGPNDLRTRKAITDLGYVTYMLDQLVSAEDLFYQSLGGREPSTWGREVFDFETMKELGTVYLLQKRYMEARDVLEDALEGLTQLLTERHRLVVLCQQYLASTYLHLQETERALEVALKGYETSVELQGDDHPDTMRAVPFIARLRMMGGNLNYAEDLLTKLAQQQRRVLGEAHADTYWTVASLATVYENQGKLALAETLFRKALDGTAAIFGSNYSSTTWIANHLYTVLRKTNQIETAKEVALNYSLEIAY